MEKGRLLQNENRIAEGVHQTIENNFPQCKHCMVHVNTNELLYSAQDREDDLTLLKGNGGKQVMEQYWWIIIVVVLIVVGLLKIVIMKKYNQRRNSNNRSKDSEDDKMY